MKGIEGTWIDFDGAAFGSGQGSSFVSESGRYQNWMSGEPNNYKGRPEDFAVPNRDGFWGDIPGNSVNPLLCQKTLEGDIN